MRKNANNYGQWRNKFQVLVAGSNGYVKQTAVTLPKPDFKAKPAMGYNTYNPAACTINQTWIRETIDVFASKGFGAAGYSVFGLDCGWQGTQRQANGSIDYDASVFPDGISPLSQHANSKGFVSFSYTLTLSLFCLVVFYIHFLFLCGRSLIGTTSIGACIPIREFLLATLEFHE